jgi:hypothetical protein
MIKLLFRCWYWTAQAVVCAGRGAGLVWSILVAAYATARLSTAFRYV